MVLLMRAEPPDMSSAPPLGALLSRNVQLSTSRLPAVTTIAPPSRLEKMLWETRTVPLLTVSARSEVDVCSSLRPSGAGVAVP
eukprot:1979021-Prymnesium_polylepis.1